MMMIVSKYLINKIKNKKKQQKRIIYKLKSKIENFQLFLLHAL